MNTTKNRQNDSRENPLSPETISVENVKRIHSLNARPSDLGFSWGSGLEMDRMVFRREDSFLVGGDLKLSC